MVTEVGYNSEKNRGSFHLQERLKSPHKYWQEVEKHLPFTSRRIAYNVVPFIRPFAPKCTVQQLSVRNLHVNNFGCLKEVSEEISNESKKEQTCYQESHVTRHLLHKAQDSSGDKRKGPAFLKEEITHWNISPSRFFTPFRLMFRVFAISSLKP